MQELPDLLMSWGINLKKIGNEYLTNCINHNDKNPSMSLYINGGGKWVAHCFSCGYHEGVIGANATLSGKTIAESAKDLSDDVVITGQRYGTISDAPNPIKLPRTMLMPPEGSMPRMDYLATREGIPFGEPAQVWVFHDADGVPIMYEARWNLTNKETREVKKEGRCFTYGKKGSAPAKWSCAHYEGVRPIYALDEIAATPGKQIVICEGARKAEAAWTLLPITCTGWTGGAQSWSKSDWSPLAGRKVILWPDADKPGREAMDGLAQHLLTLDCTVHILDTSDMPNSWDAADAVAEGWDAGR